ncbi:PRADC1-like protein [Argonauta hians]
MLSVRIQHDSSSTKYYIISRITISTITILQFILFLTVFQYGISPVSSTSYQYFEVLSPGEISYIYRIRAAENFGTPFPHIYHRVNLVVGEPHLGCSPLVNNAQVSGAVVLLKQGKCTFVTKSVHAAQAGAVAVLIADEDHNNDSEYINMIHDNSSHTVHIPALFLLGKDGWMIAGTLRRWHQIGVVNIPVNISRIPIDHLHFPPWTIW